MKKNLFIYAALCALVAAGCSKQDEAETLQPGQGEAINVTVSATRHEAPSTRTEYEDDYTGNKLIVKWNMSDKLGVFTTNNDATTTSNAAFSVDGDLSADGKTAHFKGSLTISDPAQETTVYGYYPYSSAAEITPTAIPIDLSNQQAAKDNLAHLAAKDYMAATPVTKNFSNGSQNLSLEFTPLLTIMTFSVDGSINGDVQSIKLEAIGENNITPFYTKGTVDITTEPFLISHNDVTAQSSVELSVTDGNTMEMRFNMMIFPIESKEMPAKFKVTVITTDGTVYTQTKNAPKNGFVRGKRSIMKLDRLEEEKPDVWDGTLPAANDSYPYSGGIGDEGTPYRISTAKDLAQLAANVNAKYDLDKYFSLTKNINLNEHKWTPIGKYDIGFQGTFDGGGKVITGMNITEYDTSTNPHVGLFGYVNKGTIKNINVAGEIKIEASSTKDISAGGISGYCYDATLSGNLTNNVNITIVNTDSGSLRIGGVTGSSNGAAFANVTLVNKGAVSGTSSGTQCRVGGLIGFSNNSVTFNGTNTGSVKGQISGGTGSVCSGGFIGYAGNTVNIVSSLNTGTVEAVNTSTADSANSYAGIRVGGSSYLDIVDANKDADGTSGSTNGITATAATGKSYVNGVEITPTP